MPTNLSPSERKFLLPAWLRAAMAWVVEREFRVFYFPEYLLTLAYVLPACLVMQRRESRALLFQVCALRYQCVWMRSLAAEFSVGSEPNNMSRTRDRMAYRIERLDEILKSLY